jgi:hypothetical protein
MSCECYSDVKQKLHYHFQKDAPEGSTNFEISLGGYLFGFTDDGVTHRSSNDVKITYVAPKKGGGVKKVSKKSYVRASFCPFCGVSYEAAATV